MRQRSQELWTFFQRETVFCIALLLALLSSFVVPPSKGYADYFDLRVLVLLFCLMAVVAGWKKAGAFDRLGGWFSRKARTTRGLTYRLVLLCFFSSMLVTNDVALITFVPFTLTLFVRAECTDRLIPVIVLETISANLGSMVTPIGNPQNLYLFSRSGMTVGAFVLHMLPLTLLSLLLLLLGVRCQRNEHLADLPMWQTSRADTQQPLFRSCTLLFLLCLATVFHWIPALLLFVLVVAVLFRQDRSLLLRVDYILLLTFLCFFVFIGNLGQIDWIRQSLEQLIQGRVFLLGLLSSQVISNVPAAMLLSGFTQDYGTLLWGVDLGGLGTMIASMASLISYQYYGNSKDAHKGRYVCVFTLYNVLALLPLCIAAVLLLSDSAGQAACFTAFGYSGGSPDSFLH